MSADLPETTAHAEPPSPPPPSPPPQPSPLDMPLEVEVSPTARAITPRPTDAGALAEPASHESAPGAQPCRLAFPPHVMLLVLILTLSTSVLLLTTSILASGIRELCVALVVVGCATFVIGSVSHLAQLVNENRRQSSELRRMVQEKLQLEERNEQLQAEKERLLYDVLSQQHIGRVLGRHPLEEEGRSAIRRGLQGLGPPSEAGGPAPSDSLPPLAAARGSVKLSLGVIQRLLQDMLLQVRVHLEPAFLAAASAAESHGSRPSGGGRGELLQPQLITPNPPKTLP